jgi:hypothetical protein
MGPTFLRPDEESGSPSAIAHRAAKSTIGHPLGTHPGWVGSWKRDLVDGGVGRRIPWIQIELGQALPDWG